MASSTLSATFAPLTPAGRLGLLLALAIGLATGGGLMLWSGDGDYRIVSAGLRAGDIPSAVQELQVHGIPLNVDDAGVIRVPAKHLPRARLLLAGKVWPESAWARTETAGSTSPQGKIRRLEANYAARIERLLTPLVGPGQVRADVSIDVSPARRDQPSGPGFDGADGIPGPAGGPGRLSVAVVVGDRMLQKEGQAVREVLGPGELDRITALIKDVVGFSEARGDHLSVVNAPFAAGPRESLPDYRAPLQSAAGWALLTCGLLLFLPASRALLRRGSGGAKRISPDIEPAPAVSSSEMQASSGLRDSQQVDGAASGLDEQVQALRTFAGQDPKRVAQVVKRWLSEEERG